MNDLIKKVKVAIEEVPWVDKYVNDSEGEARAAIAAVAEWIETEAVYGRERRVSDILKKQLEQPK